MSEYELNRLLKDKRRAEAKGNLREVAQILNAIGEIYSKLGRHEDAIEQHEMELRLSEALDDTVGAAVAHRKIGECHCEMADYDRALHHQKLHLVLAEKAGSNTEIQRAHATIGRTYLFQAEALEGLREQRVLKKAELSFWKSFEVCKRLESVIDNRELMEMKSRLLLNLALVHDNRGETKKSSELIKRAIHLAEKGNLYEDLHRCHYTLSDMLERSGQLNHALRSIDTSIKCAQKAKDKFAEWAAIEKKAKIYLQVKDFLAARKCLKKTLKLKCPTEQHKITLENLLRKVRLLGHYNDQIALTNESDHNLLLRYSEKMADLFVDLKLYKPALEYYHKMLDHALAMKKTSDELIPVYVSLSQTYKDDKQYKKAIIYSRKEIECHGSNHSQVCRTLLNIAEYQELAGEDYSEIKSSYEEALKYAIKAKDTKLQFLVLKSLSIVQKLYKDEDLPSTEVKLKKMMASYGYTMDDELSDIDSQERKDDDDDDDESDISLEDFTDTDTTEDEEFSKPSAEDCPNVGQARRMTSIKRNEKGETPLHRACIDGRLRTVKTLVEKGHPVNPRDFCGWLPLHEAANHGFVEIVAYLIDKGAWINDRGGEKCNGVTPLHDAAANGNLEVVKLLIQRGANVHAKDDEGNTALDCLRDYREGLGEDIGRTEMAEIVNVERLLSRTMNGNNPHLPSKAISTGNCEDLDEIPEMVSRKRRKAKQKTPLRLSEYDGDDDVPDNPGDPEIDQPLLRVDLSDLDQLQNPSTARSAYREAMTELGSAASKVHLATQQAAADSTDKGPALISADEVAGDDWLIEDVRPTMKRKRLDVDSVFKGTNVTRKRRATPNQGASKKHRVWITDPDDQEDYIVDDDDAEITAAAGDGDDDEDDDRRWISLGRPDRMTVADMTNSGPDVADATGLDAEVMCSLASQSRRTKQLTLTQCSSVTRSGQRSYQRSPVNQQRASTTDVTASSSKAGSDSTSAVLRFRVKIKDVTLLVPVQKGDDEPLISALAAAASDRYYKMFNLRPILSLSKDGAILSPDEPITLVLSNDEEVEGIVSGWDLPPLPVRYVDACKSLKTTVYRNIRTALSKCENDHCLHLDGLALRPTQFMPVTRALQYHTLKELHILGNKLSDSGIQQLAKVLHTLCNVTVIDLSSNNITSSGLSALVDCITTQANSWQKPLQSLEVLRLSHNPLGDGSSSCLVALIDSLPQLTALYLADCQLTVRFFRDQRVSLTEKLNASRLQTIDMSYNNLGTTGIELLLMCVNPRMLLSLNVSNTVKMLTNNTISKHLEHYMQKTDCVLEKLFVDGCFLSADNLADICRFIRQSRSLQMISLCNHPKLSLDDLQQIITSSNSSSLQSIIMTGCYFSNPLSTDFLDAVMTKTYSDRPLKQISFQLAGNLNEVDKMSLKQIWLDKWPEIGRYSFLGGTAKLWIDES